MANANRICRAQYSVRFFEAGPGLWTAEASAGFDLTPKKGATLLLAQSKLRKALADHCRKLGIEVGSNPDGAPDIQFRRDHRGEDLWIAGVYTPKSKKRETAPEPEEEATTLGEDTAEDRATKACATDFRHVWAKVAPSPFLPGPGPALPDIERKAIEGRLASLAKKGRISLPLTKEERAELAAARLILRDAASTESQRKEALYTQWRLPRPDPKALPESEREHMAREASLLNRSLLKPALTDSESRDAVRILQTLFALLADAKCFTPEMSEFACWHGCRVARAKDPVAALKALTAAGRGPTPTPLRNKAIRAEVDRQRTEGLSREDAQDFTATTFGRSPKRVAGILEAHGTKRRAAR